MADNTTLNAGTGGDVIASDDISGVKHQRVKLVLGNDGVSDGDVSSTNPVPVKVKPVSTTGTISALNGTVELDVDGSAGCIIDVRGTFVATYVYEGTVDNSNWFSLFGPLVGSVGTTSIPTGIANTATASFLPCAGCLKVRARASAYTSGTLTVTIKAVPGTSAPYTIPLGITKVEDSAALSGDAGVMVLGVRNDNAATSQTSANGDYGAPALDSNGAVFTRPRQLTTYTATCRAASRPYALSNAFTANTTKQFVTIYHGASATKTVRIREISVALESSSAAAITVAYISYLTNAVTPATGNPAITPRPFDPAAAAAEVTVLALPTTGGTESGAWLGFEQWNSGITGAAPTTNPPPPLNFITIFSEEANTNEGQPLLIRAGVAEGYSVTFDCNAASTVKGYVIIKFTEE